MAELGGTIHANGSAAEKSERNDNIAAEERRRTAPAEQSGIRTDRTDYRTSGNISLSSFARSDSKPLDSHMPFPKFRSAG